MEIRIGTIEEFKKLWKYSQTPTFNYFLKNIEDRNVEFWTVVIDRNLIAELYIFWNSEDSDEANGKDRAYLCAFRVHKDYQNQGIGQKLMAAVTHRIYENGFSEITIGIDNKEYEKLHSLYNKLGFNEIVKESYIDFHYLDKNNQPVEYDQPCMIMLKSKTNT